MPARTGEQYVQALRQRQPTIFLNGRRIGDVCSETAFGGVIRSVAELYDIQLDPLYREFMLYPSPSSGEPVHISFLAPTSRRQLINKRKAFKLRTDHSFGFLGRSMDFMNNMVLNMHLGRERFAQRGQRFADNVTRYYEYVRENDLFLTHALINPQIDRSRTSAEQEEAFLHLGKVRDTPEGIVVRGAKMLATMAPITEEILCFPFGAGVAEGDDAYAVAFAVPIDAPGLKLLCREPVGAPQYTRFDHPLSSRFEEMDCIVVFDDVLVPWERVFIDGSAGSREVANAAGGGTGLTGGVQTAARMLSQMEFFCGLAMKLAEAINITTFLHVQEKLGEMLSNLEVARAVFYGSEAMAYPLPDGIWTNAPIGPGAFHVQTMRIYRRFVEIVQLLAGGGFFYAPTEADFANPESRADIDRYARGRAGVSAEERVRLFKLAWDASSSSFAQRMQQYVTYYSGDPIRLTAAFYLGYDRDPLLDVVDRALGARDDLDIAVSPDEPGRVPPRRSPRDPFAISAQYPTATQPRPTKPASASDQEVKRPDTDTRD